MKKMLLLPLLIAALLMIAACAGGTPTPQLDPGADGPTQEIVVATDEPTPTAEPTEQPTPEPTPEPVKTVPWALEGSEIIVNVPESWTQSAQLLDLLTESPDVDHFYAVAFAPAGITLSQEAYLGFFYVVKSGIWDDMGGQVADAPLVEIGRAGQWVVGYSGSSDNPYIIGSQESDLFDEMMVRNQDAPDVLSVVEE